MNRSKLIYLVFCVSIVACTDWNGNTTLSPDSFPLQTKAFTLTPSPEISDTTLNLSSQPIINTKEKWNALYSFGVQVIDNDLSLHVENLQQGCYMKVGVDSAQIPLSARFVFTNNSSHTIVIPDSFAFSSGGASVYTGADFSTVFFSDNEEAIFADGDNSFHDFNTEVIKIVEIPPNESYQVILQVKIPIIFTKEGNQITTTPGFYIKFIHWTAKVERASDPPAWHVAQAISSNTIFVCIE
ncbi:MAG: hypothetical protein HY867_13310 [Chloroflexi bacterium]|nr:hypothetical protein [Chloroflexota bacterium]